MAPLKSLHLRSSGKVEYVMKLSKVRANVQGFNISEKIKLTEEKIM